MRIWLLLLFIPGGILAQQVLPAWGPAFLQDEVAEIRLTIDPDSLDALLSGQGIAEEHEYPVTFVYESSGTLDSITNVGCRLRGNTSLNAAKKSFKISFNSFLQGGDWQGLEKLNLVANQNDPSLLRAKLCWDFIRYAGLPGSRTSFVRLFINGEYRGLYVNTEHIDEEWASAYFPDGTGNLWKCLYPADLDYIDNNPESYKLEAWGNRVYDLKTNRELDDYRKLADFISILNNTNDANFACQIEDVFNVDFYLRYLAIDILTGNWDNYAFNKNNFYLYHNEATGRIEYIPYDLDNTLGIDWVNQDWAERSIYDWSPGFESRVLYERVMETPEFRNRFTSYIEEYTTTYFNNGVMLGHASELQSLITDDLLEDPYYPLDFGFSTSDFLNAIDQEWGGHVDYSISAYLTVRSQSVLAEIENEQSAPAVTNQMAGFTDGALVIRAIVTEGTNPYAAYRSTSGPDWTYIPMVLLGDPSPEGTNVFAAVVADVDPLLSYEYGVHASGLPSAPPCVTRYLYSSDSPIQLVINELLTSGNTQIADQSGDYDEWIELYNAGVSPIYLGNKYITDDPLNWNKWLLPNVTLEPGSFLLLWADDEEDEGYNHLNFRLSAQGEYIAIYDELQDERWKMDEVYFGPQISGISYGREYDGDPDWITFDIPTPGSSNNTVTVEETTLKQPWIQAYPDRTNENIVVAGLNPEPIRVIGLELFNTSGQCVRSAVNWVQGSTIQIPTTGLSAGIYKLHLLDGREGWVFTVFVP